MKWKTKKDLRKRRHWRLRHKVTGSAERPRMCVNTSNRHMAVQFIDDRTAHTLASVSTRAKGNAKHLTTEVAAELGKQAAEKAQAVGIQKVVFDRGGMPYGSRIKAMADAAREGGLQF
jgi:large subunit ribosomal protein L18